MSDHYKNYQEWKAWDGESSAPTFQLKYFGRETTLAGMKPPDALLEVGFGNGEFLRWAKDEGFKVTGWEIIPELVEKLSESGLSVDLRNVAAADFPKEDFQEHFDAIVALDVFEHLTVEDATQFLLNVQTILKPGGRILLRFPNGGSPFGLPLQNGDHTHRQALTESKMKQLLCGVDLELSQFRNTTRKINWGSKTAFLRPLLFITTDIIEIFVGYLYWGRRIPLDKSCVAVLRKPARTV